MIAIVKKTIALKKTFRPPLTDGKVSKHTHSRSLIITAEIWQLGARIIGSKYRPVGRNENDGAIRIVPKQQTQIRINPFPAEKHPIIDWNKRFIESEKTRSPVNDVSESGEITAIKYGAANIRVGQN